MKILIEVELEDCVRPSYTARVHDALLRLIANQLHSGDFGEFAFERIWNWYGIEESTTTVVRVSKAPPTVPEMVRKSAEGELEAVIAAREEVARINASAAATAASAAMAAVNFSSKGS